MIGIVLLDKPLGISSSRALQTVKRLLRAEKAGHVGSLDPLATGMLPICLGEATKIAGDILSMRKQYRFAMKLGERTATGDTEGTVVETRPVPPLDQARIDTALRQFLGPQQQVPPMYSAIKQGGQPLYKLARAGQEVPRAPRAIEIFELRQLAADGAVIELQTLCSKGTYIRTLAEDISRALGTCGHVIRLRRLYVEPFEHEAMQTLEELAQAPRILPADRGVPQLAPVRLLAAAAAQVMRGQAVAVADATLSGRVRLYDAEGRFFGIGHATQGMVHPRRLWAAGVRE